MPTFLKMLRRWKAIVRDLQLLGGELTPRTRVAFPRRLAARPQFHARSLSPRVCSQRLESIECALQVRTRVDAAPAAAEEFAVGEFGAGALEGTGALGVDHERCLEEALGLLLLLGEERAAVQGDRACPCGPAAFCPRFEDREPVAGGLGLACADRGLDPVESNPEGDGGGGDVSRAQERLLGPAESELEQSQRPIG